jgi:hypothetical protein
MPMELYRRVSGGPNALKSRVEFQIPALQSLYPPHQVDRQGNKRPVAWVRKAHDVVTREGARGVTCNENKDSSENAL